MTTSSHTQAGYQCYSLPFHRETQALPLLCVLKHLRKFPFPPNTDTWSPTNQNMLCQWSQCICQLVAWPDPLEIPYHCQVRWIAGVNLYTQWWSHPATYTSPWLSQANHRGRCSCHSSHWWHYLQQWSSAGWDHRQLEAAPHWLSRGDGALIPRSLRAVVGYKLISVATVTFQYV